MQLPIKIIVPSEETFDKARKSGRGHLSSHVFFALDWQKYESEERGEVCPTTVIAREVLDSISFCMHTEHFMQLGHLMHMANETEETLPIPRADTMVREASLKVRNAYLRTAFDLLYDTVHGVVSMKASAGRYWGRIALCRFLYPIQKHHAFDIAFGDIEQGPKRRDEVLEGFQIHFREKMDERKRKVSAPPPETPDEYSEETRLEIAKLRTMLYNDVLGRHCHSLLACVSATINRAFASNSLGELHPNSPVPSGRKEEAFSRFFDVFMSVVRSKERIFPEESAYEHVYRTVSDQVNKVRSLLDKEQVREQWRKAFGLQTQFNPLSHRGS